MSAEFQYLDQQYYQIKFICLFHYLFNLYIINIILKQKMKINNQKKENVQKQQKGGSVNLNWSCNKCSSNKLELFDQDLLKRQYLVKQLIINLNESHLNDKTMKNLSEILLKAKIQENLQLNLVSCIFESYYFISEILQSQNQLVNLSLNFGAVNMFNGQIDFICKGIINYYNLQKFKLNLTGCSIQDQGMETLADCLVQFKKLKHLDLNIQQNRLGEKSGNHFSSAICSLQELSILKINLYQNYIFTSDLLANSIKNLGSLNKLQDIYIQVSYKTLIIAINDYPDYVNYLTNFFNELSKCVNLKSFSIDISSSAFMNQLVCQHFNKAIISMQFLKILRISAFRGQLVNLNQLLSGIEFHQSLVYLNIDMDTLPIYLIQHQALKKAKRLVICQH
ncbi:transmembrane protein, putative (macronuclear) [Tetrahymena thermophila SB210]|uniref:Transmembrane protein, putative n=1 Tax=Tetrahymena thermophila (strain SB210) TaxID=312017 RepID=W7X9N8_TETTS|nr:transmembrane protein, putative [Tetrahymena thermophila SB210]EWS74057.1 transmembrane protein, putative [Tetrahymena thermophila SB210]|eukprot:XP_012653390.1 transmembrane protein, putative [Tetrahymena thermophila SB210]